jgi:hypothetical protein
MSLLIHARLRVVAVTAAVAIAATACSRTVKNVPIAASPAATIAELWQAPDDPASRDLFDGPGGAALRPRQTAFAFVAEDTTGHSPGFDVRDNAGIEWSVKTGPEAQSEVVTSRILWAIGFHQPPTYYLDNWSLTGTVTGKQEPGRFRPDLPGREVIGEWPWHENPFVGSREFGGLIVANLLLTSWDWKRSNNKIYQLSEPIDGVQRWFVVRDLGASLGRFTYPGVLKWFRLRGFGQGTRNDLPGFEQQGFIKAIDPDTGKVEFEYRGIYRDVISTVRAEDVRWACQRLATLSDQQWQDAFRAAGYTPDQSSRYIAKIKEKIAQGLELTASGL